MPRISVCVEDALLQAIDEAAAEAGALRSDAIRTALEELLQPHVTTPQESA